MILAPLRGVTIRCFREVFAEPIREAGFTEAFTPFIAAIAGSDPLRDRELAERNNRNNRIIELSNCRIGGDNNRNNRIVELSNRRIGGDNNRNNRIVELSNRRIGGDNNRNNRIVELSNCRIGESANRGDGFLKVTPQFIGKDPAALRSCLERIRSAGYDTADLNCGCPYPMVRCKGRGSGILKTPDVLRAMLEVGCSVMGAGNFSVKARLGVERPDELLGLMPLINGFPLRFLTVHARTARQMYGGQCDWSACAAIEGVAKMPVVRNGDLSLPGGEDRAAAPGVMVGRAFIVALGEREDIGAYLRRYIEASERELSGAASVLGRLKELIAYWRLLPAWHRRWNAVKLCRTVDELRLSLPD